MNLLISPNALPHPPRYIIDPVAFFVALIFGPLVFTALTFWALFIPVFALGFGFPVYLIVGTPVLLWYLRHNDGDPSDLGFLAGKLILLGTFFAGGAAALAKEQELMFLIAFYAGFGLIFGSAWAYFFGKVYQRLRGDFFAKPRSF